MDNLKLNKENKNKFFHNIMVFIAPVLTVYIVSIIGIIQAHDGAIALKDFVPTAFTWGAITLYILNTALDYLRKLKAS